MLKKVTNNSQHSSTRSLTSHSPKNCKPPVTSSQFTPSVIHLSHIFISFLNQIVCEADSLVITNTLQFLSLSLSLSFPPFFTLHSVPLITSTQFISRFLSSGINDNVAHGRKPKVKKIYLSFPANFTCPYIYTFSIHFTLNFYLRICTFHLAYKKNFSNKNGTFSLTTPPSSPFSFYSAAELI